MFAILCYILHISDFGFIPIYEVLVASMLVFLFFGFYGWSLMYNFGFREWATTDVEVFLFQQTLQLPSLGWSLFLKAVGPAELKKRWLGIEALWRHLYEISWVLSLGHIRNLLYFRTVSTLVVYRYLEFVNARRASFVSLKSASKFRELLQTSSDGNFEALKLSGVTYDLLGKF